MDIQNTIRIISRNSELALWQARFVEQEIKRIYPQVKVEIKGITTQGDKLLDRSLDKIGGKGLFIKELEQSLLCNEADIAVHSLKDLPANLMSEFTIAAILERENPRDAFISNTYKTLKEMPVDAIIGTSSIRRVAILNKYYPHLKVRLLRGNILTRLKKLDCDEYDGIILAVAGLKRLGLEERIKEYLSKDQFVPAIGQGALAIEVLSSNSELITTMNKLNDEDTSIAVLAERELGRLLQASCSVPIAAHATIKSDILQLHAIILDKESNQYCSATISGLKADYKQIANNSANELLRQGAASILKKYT